MAETTRILSPSNPEWDIWLKRAPHDFYHLSAYHSFAERVGEGEAEMVVYGTPERFLAWPYLVRKIEGEYLDANSVYGYSGPTGRGLDDDAFRTRAWQGLKEAWRVRRFVTIFTRFHPLLGNEQYCESFLGAAPTPGGEILHLGRSVSIDLTDDRETRLANYRQALRHAIRQAERCGMMIDLDSDWHYYQKFVDLYSATMGRLGAAKRYKFSPSYFDSLREALDGKLHLATASFDGEVAATILFTVYNGIAQAHFGASDKAYDKLSPIKGLIDGVADIARGLGANRLHLGAGRGGSEDSLFEFKGRFSRSRHNFRTGRWILDCEANTELSQQSPTSDDIAYFPAYRAAAEAEAVAT